MIVENYMKHLKESVYHRPIVSAPAVDFTVLGKSFMKMSPHLSESLMLRMVQN